ncbi:hypothetical protein KN10_1511 [Anoxybacillus flavithermus NBRC 109594]|uniref:Uncharacterized protein n=1 Tax=Anoxybacillus flavithermus NBRC 109594 TaxID=1315967 RepID=R4FE27_9BACL|nr:hypothetical protein KN10_1511 [Anoxybacillus flavithermus NBRC 109594]
MGKIKTKIPVRATGIFFIKVLPTSYIESNIYMMETFERR